jgi:DNA invertase Pin-like site-specific DNA recombinase
MIVMARFFAYILGSANPLVRTIEEQKQAIGHYCRRIGIELDGTYIDSPPGGRLPVLDRVAGRRLEGQLVRGDHVIIPDLDSVMAAGIRWAAVTLDRWCRAGVNIHILRPACYLDADSPHARKLAEMLVELAEAANRAIGARRLEGHQRAKAEGRRRSRFAPFGFAFVDRNGKSFLAPEPSEQIIRRRVLELDAMGYSVDQIRRYLSYEWKVRNRNNREFGYTEIYRMIRRGAEEMAEATEPAAAPEQVEVTPTGMREVRS